MLEGGVVVQRITDHHPIRTTHDQVVQLHQGQTVQDPTAID
jgi:hypothetical protein